MSEVKVNKISPRTNCGTVQLGDSGDTITIPSGATITNNGTQTGFGKTGAVDYITAVKTANFTATAGEGYFVNTAGGAVTVTLPGSPSAGDMVVVSDYNGSAGTNSITIDRNSNKINGGTDNLEIAKANTAIQLVFVDATTGFQNVATADPADVQNLFVDASGGTETESGDFRIHTFTGPGTFTVSNAGTSGGSNSVSYLVVAGGGGGGGTEGGGGGGGGGFREGKASSDCYSASPLVGGGLPVSVQAYPITVGGGGAAGPQASAPRRGTSGVNSVFSTITSAGGGGGGGGCATAANRPGADGGSGGGGGEYRGTSPAGAGSGGSGNTPSVSPPQGTNGAAGHPSSSNPNGAGGGGGATVAGTAGKPNGGGCGGAGATTSINGSPVARAGGGGGGVFGPAPQGAGGTGGGGTGGQGSPSVPGVAGTTNTGGGGGGGGNGCNPGSTGAAGGSGIVIIRYKFQ